MHSFYIHGHRAQLQGELVIIHVSANGDEALEGCAVVSASRRTYVPIYASPFAKYWQIRVQQLSLVM
jgi:hypothetical protein